MTRPKKDESIRVYLPAEAKEQAETLAAKRGSSLSSLMLGLLLKWVDEETIKAA